MKIAPSRRREIFIDLFLIALFAAILIRPLFKAKYFDKWESIESTFISDARFLIEHWPHPQWQPLWYAGTRFDYIYPPMLRYGTAIISKTTHFWPVKAYHFYTAFFYAIGIAGVYLLARVGTKSRAAAWLAAAATALMSPSFLFLARFRSDAWKLIPVRLGVLVKYGEGPHITALSLIPFALAFTWLALERRRPAAIGAAALFCALVASNNFYGATSLAMFYPVLVWSFWITRQDKTIVLPALLIPALAYGLTAFWLVASYFKVTAINMKYISEHGTTWSIWVGLAVAIAYAIATDRLARGKTQHTWSVFAAGAVVVFSLNVLGNEFFHFRITGEPSRQVPELDLVYILGAVTVLMWMWSRGTKPYRIAAALIVVAAFSTTAGYLRHAWHMFPLYPDYQNRIEYQVTDWIHRNMPDSRVYTSGSVRFWFDAWHDLAQVGGGSDQGVLNTQVEPAQWETNLGPDFEPALLWTQATGADAVYVAEKDSQEHYRDFLYPQKMTALPVIWDSGHGDHLYRVPRRYPARARIVETARINAVAPPRFNNDVEYLHAYVDTIEKGPDSVVTVARQGTDAMQLHATLAPGQSIVVQETYDPAWRAWSGDRELPIRKDAIDMMVIDAPPGEHQIRLAFLTPLENKIGRVLTALSLLAVVALFALGAKS